MKVQNPNTKFLKVLASRIGTSLAVPNGMRHALNTKELDIIKKFAIKTLDEVKSKSCHLDWSEKVDGAFNVNEHYLLGSKLKCFPSTSSTTEQAVKQGKATQRITIGSGKTFPMVYF